MSVCGEEDSQITSDLPVIDFERSNYIKRRNHLIRTRQGPILSEAFRNLGPSAAQVVCEQCVCTIKKDFGLEPFLCGAGDDLWCSPSDLLIGKVCLKPPLTNKHLKALTHEGILEIGFEVERKYWNELEMEKQRALEEQKILFRNTFETKLLHALKDVELRERESCMREIDKLTLEFEDTLVLQLDALERRLREEFELGMELNRQNASGECEKRINLEVERVTASITQAFLEDMALQKELLHESFNLELSKAELKRNFDLELEKAKCREQYQKLRHNLECRNVANMIYVLCMERRKCQREKKAIENHYEEKLNKLIEIIKAKDLEIENLIKERDAKVQDVQLRENCILKVIREFQKFINFALKAVPTQAEFLLSLEKLMVFELVEAVLNSDLKHLTQIHQTLLPWKESDTVECNPKESLNKMVVQDYHDCVKEVDLTISQELERNPSLALPCFIFKDNLYVREDFRNMASQGLKVNPESDMWSKEVEVLIDKFQLSKPSGSRSGARNTEDRKQPSTVRFSTLSSSNGPKDEKQKRSTSIKLSTATTTNIDYDKLGRDRKSTLIETCSSLELLRKKKPSLSIGRSEDSLEREAMIFRNQNPALQSIQSLISDGEDRTDLPWGVSSSILKKTKKDSPKASKDSERHLSLTAKDSITVCTIEKVKKSKDFQIEVKDSVEVLEDAHTLRQVQASKLSTAKSSLEILRSSYSTTSPKCIRQQGNKSTWTKKSSKTVCTCAKCKPSNSIEVITAIVDAKPIEYQIEKPEVSDKGIKVSKIEVFHVENPSDTSVAFKSDLEIFEAEVLYQETKANKEKKKVPKAKKPKPVREVKVVGDRSNQEEVVNPVEFTNSRIHSFISLIKDYPDLIRLFTAGRR